MQSEGTLLEGVGVDVLIAASALAVSLVGLVAMRRYHAVVKSSYVSSLIRQWAELYDDWTLSLLLARGSDDYYVGASLKQRQRIKKLVKRIDGEGISKQVNLLRARSPHLRRVTTFFAYCADLIFSGRLLPIDVYRVLGPDVARHGAAVRWISGCDFLIKEQREDRDQLFQGLESAVRETDFRGEQELVLGLIDVLWAEAARCGDNQTHSLLGAATHKVKTKSGRKCRRRVWRLTLARGMRPLVAFSITRRMRTAEYIPLGVVVRDIEETIDLSAYIDIDLRNTRVVGWPRPLDRLIARLLLKLRYGNILRDGGK